MRFFFLAVSEELEGPPSAICGRFLALDMCNKRSGRVDVPSLQSLGEKHNTLSHSHTLDAIRV
jgi:hypothetical protein